MKFNELPREIQDEIMMIGHRSEIRVEDDKRRQSTRLGYRLGGTFGLTVACFGMVFATGFTLIGLAFAAPSSIGLWRPARCYGDVSRRWR